MVHIDYRAVLNILIKKKYLVIILSTKTNTQNIQMEENNLFNDALHTFLSLDI